MARPRAGRRRRHRRSRGRHARCAAAPGSPSAPPARSCWRCTCWPPTGCPARRPRAIAAQRALVESLGGTFHTVVGEDVAQRASSTSRAGVNATMIVVGVSRRSRWREALTGEQRRRDRPPRRDDRRPPGHPRAGPRRAAATGRALRAVPPRRTAGWAGRGARGRRAAHRAARLTAGRRQRCPPTSCSSSRSPSLVALVGGLWPAVVSAVVGFLLLNWFFTPPDRAADDRRAGERARAGGLRAGRGRRRLGGRPGRPPDRGGLPRARRGVRPRRGVPLGAVRARTPPHAAGRAAAGDVHARRRSRCCERAGRRVATSWPPTATGPALDPEAAPTRCSRSTTTGCSR